jgi:hypothetical protein
MSNKNTYHYISSNFSTKENRPIFFTEDGIARYGTSSYANALSFGTSILEDTEKEHIITINPIESVVSTSQTTSIIQVILPIDYSMDSPQYEKRYNSTSFTKKDKRSSKRYRKKSKHNGKFKRYSKEGFWKKLNEDFDEEELFCFDEEYYISYSYYDDDDYYDCDDYGCYSTNGGIRYM